MQQSEIHQRAGMRGGAGLAPEHRVRAARRKVRVRILFLLSLVVLIFFLGPRTPIDTTIDRMELPDNLEALERFIADSERQYNDVIPGAEKAFIWQNSQNKQKTPLSIVYIHGFSATRQETAPLSDIVADRFGANLYYTRLTGHGRHRSEMAHATANDWLNDAVMAMEVGRRIGERVLLIACSTGGTLASWVALEDQADLLAIVLLAPNFGLYDPRGSLIALPWAKYFVPLIAGDTVREDAVNPRHAAFWHTEYPVQALFPMGALVSLLRRTDFSQWQTPTLLMISPNDTTVDVSSAEKKFNEIGTAQKELQYVTVSDDVSPHVFAGDIRAPQGTQEVADRIITFLLPIIGEL